MAAALPIKPILAVFSLRCGVSEMIDAGIVIEILFLVIFCASGVDSTALSLKGGDEI
jgi:hypothetical protein